MVLRENEIGDAGACSLADAIKASLVLRAKSSCDSVELHLACDMLSDVGCCQLCCSSGWMIQCSVFLISDADSGHASRRRVCWCCGRLHVQFEVAKHKYFESSRHADSELRKLSVHLFLFGVHTNCPSDGHRQHVCKTEYLLCRGGLGMCIGNIRALVCKIHHFLSQPVHELGWCWWRNSMEH